MDDLTARLRAEKDRGPSAADIAAYANSLRRLSDDLEAFLATANTGRPTRHARFKRAVSASTGTGFNSAYQPYDTAD